MTAAEAGAEAAAPRWRVATDADALGRRPLAVALAGRHLVLFRGPDGRPRALEDRCPHRGVPLSLGACRRGTLECAYHGWRFDGAGALREVPSSVDEAPPRVAVPAYAAVERDGFVWVADGAEAAGAPPDLGLRGFAWRRWTLVDARPADVVREDLARGGALAWPAPDRAEAEAGRARTILLLAPEAPGRTRVEVLAGRRSWLPLGRRVDAAAGWPVPLAGEALAPWLDGRSADADWRLAEPWCRP